MKVMQTIAVLAIVSGCTTTVQQGSSAQAIVNATNKLCGFAPTVTSILAILNVPAAPAADKIVQEICAVVEKNTQAGFIEPGQKVTVTVFGKPVQGELTK
jgi:hypothetical protein